MLVVVSVCVLHQLVVVSVMMMLDHCLMGRGEVVMMPLLHDGR